MDQAAYYSAALQYLNAVKAVKSTDPDLVMAELKKAKINDMFTKNGYIRADGLMVHTMYVMQVKTPAESKYPWDYYKVIKVMPGEEADGRAAGSDLPAGQEVVGRPDGESSCTGCVSGDHCVRRAAAGDSRPAHAGAGQRIVLCASESWSRGDLRAPRGRQFRAWRLLHARGVCGVHRIADLRRELLVRAHPRAAGGGAPGGRHRALVSAASVSPRSAVRAAA